jgi:FHS family L-fucose permease-like MFS transporter
MAIFKKHSLRAGNTRTRAAELTLRESIFPLCLVTILFFLWVRNPTQRSVLPGCVYG